MHTSSGHTFTGGEFIVMGVPGLTLDDATRKIIMDVQPSGFILFARNIKDPSQLRALTDDLRTVCRHEPIITIDQEGGRVSRLKEFMTEPPSAMQLTEHGDLDTIAEHGILTGKLLRLFGFNLNLAPVLDTLVDIKNENSLKDRTYGTTADQVVANASAFARGMAEQGMLCCGKHYPGYSMANVDPHHGLPTVKRSLEQLLALEWLPFKRTLPRLDLVMVGHVSYPDVDPSCLPATLSRTMVHQILREDWHFEGCTITDDMDMGAIKANYGGSEAAASALKAGNDLMLVCHAIDSVPEIAATLLTVPEAIRQQSYQRILALRTRLAAPVAFSLDAFKKLDEETARLRARVIRQSSPLQESRAR
ncbi:MAG: beta-N-acetylhexosaminidase [Cyanobacteria bacterium REEB67]|nr:beta-N-acetylhexosaminidase [Cyanobacteria bacterium REEB67]